MNDQLMILNRNETGQMQIERVMGSEEVKKLENNELLVDFPKAKAYIKACVSYFPTTNKFIEKAINNRQQIENTLTDYTEFDIDLAISRSYVFNKDRPTPLQVIALLTGEKDGDLKKREIQNKKESLTFNKKYNEVEKYFNKIKKETLTEYLNNPQREEVFLNTNSICLNVLDEIMTNFITWQAYILTFIKNNIQSCGIGLSEHFHKISAVRDMQPSYPRKCFTTYLRSDLFREQVLNNKKISSKIPTAFVEYIKNYFEDNKIMQKKILDNQINQNQNKKDNSPDTFKNINFEFLNKVINKDKMNHAEEIELNQNNIVNVF